MQVAKLLLFLSNNTASSTGYLETKDRNNYENIYLSATVSNAGIARIGSAGAAQLRMYLFAGVFSMMSS